MSDKEREYRRYDDRARRVLASIESGAATGHGDEALPVVFGAPYSFYESRIREIVKQKDRVLELGAGLGAHTRVLLEAGGHVTATDISPHSLQVLQKTMNVNEQRLKTHVADIEGLPFEPESFDVVVSAGSLSYGDSLAVDSEVQRVLRRGGSFICIDSYNHNPIYRLNRWIQYLRGLRSRGTLLNMPDEARLRIIARRYESVEVKYFGSVSWAMPLISRFLGEVRAARLSDLIDEKVNVQRAAFKFVLVARGCRKQ